MAPFRARCITGRVLFHETIRKSIARNISKDLGDMTLPHLPVNLQPFMVAESSELQE